MNAPLPPEDVDGLTLPPAWAAPARARGSRRLVLGGSVVGLAALGTLAVMGFRAPSPDSLYETAAVTRQDIESTVAATGKIQPHAYVDVGAQVSGQLKRLHVAVGDKVTAGMVVAEIDAEMQAAKVEGIEADLARLSAELAEQEAGLVFAKRNVERHLTLSQTSAVSQLAFETTTRDRDILIARIDASKARIRQMQADLRAQKTALRFARITAPMGGTVVSVDAKEGQTLNANYDTPLILQIADLDTMTVWTDVSEADVVKLREGMPLWFTTLGRPDRKWHARLRQIQPAPRRPDKKAEPKAATQSGNVVLYTALFDIPNEDGGLRAGMTAQVFFVTAASKDALVVPVSALSEGRVRVLLDDGKIAARKLETGVRTRFLVEVTRGVAEGERVITGVKAPGPPAKLRVES
ncbi:MULTISPECIES: efflux RND transporter periplasmic adaptor subunit [unclassified Nitrobacter]|uniref:efflux RND transporter periplasmic adaptor subunit n=1 Tax=unclassified Nitrobacter TaxID=2620411 RepID=UPI001FDA7582|nr:MULTISPECIES: efflux RND transporter periplasmic adaptor subunit [unclassified Nitrobacter]